jgi:uncharacterized protein (TIGR03382 family)
MGTLPPVPFTHLSTLIMTTRHTLALAACLLLTGANAHATLVARNLDTDSTTAEAYYDTSLGITWMRDTQALSHALGLGSSTFNHADALGHLAAFNANGSANHGFSQWRLPGAGGVHSIGGAGCQFGFNGSTDCGSNVDVASSELAHLFHATLGNTSQRDSSGNFRPGTAGIDWGLANDGDFDNLLAGTYWTGTTSYRLIFNLPQHGQVTFNLLDGSQSILSPTSQARAWLVHDGDIGSAVSSALNASVVPLPGTLPLAALGLLALARRRRG